MAFNGRGNGIDKIGAGLELAAGAADAPAARRWVEELSSFLDSLSAAGRGPPGLDPPTERPD